MNDNYSVTSFETDTAKLWFAGTRLLPSLAQTYSEVTQTVAATRGSYDDAFATSTSLTGNLSGMYAEWDRLRSSFQDILATTSKNLVGTGEALNDLATELSHQDAAGAREITNAEADLKDDPIDVEPPVHTRDGVPAEDSRPDERHRGHRELGGGNGKQ